MSGLVSALYLQKAGWQTTLLEQQDEPGGVTRSLKKDGFIWDQGQLLLEGLLEDEKAGYPLNELGVLEQIELIPGYRGYIFPDYAIWPQKEFKGFRWKEEYLSSLFPDQKQGLKKYFRLYKAMNRASWANLKSEQKKGLASFLWKLRSLAYILPYLPQKDATAEEMGKKLFSDPKLAACFLSLLADFEVKPSHFPGLGIPMLNEEAAFDKRLSRKMPGGGYQPSYRFIKGGTISLVNALINEFKKQGGTLQCSSNVSSIIIEEDIATGVKLETGESLSADLVVADMNSEKAFFELVDKNYWPAEFAKEIENIPLMESVFMVHLGIEGHLLDYQPGPLGYYYKTYEIEEAIETIFKGEFGAGDLGYLVYGPSSHSPEMAPPGHTALTIYTVAPNKANQGSWDVIAEESADILISRVEKDLIPGISEKIKTKMIVTPDDFKKNLRIQGVHSFGGMAPRLNGKGAPHKTPLKNYWFVGGESVDGGTITNTVYGAWKAMKELGAAPLK